MSQGDSQTQLTALRDEGNKHFGKKDYAKALECYDKALKSIPATHQDKPLLHSNKAACHMMGKKYVFGAEYPAFSTYILQSQSHFFCQTASSAQYAWSL